MRPPARSPDMIPLAPKTRRDGIVKRSHRAAEREPHGHEAILLATKVPS